MFHQKTICLLALFESPRRANAGGSQRAYPAANREKIVLLGLTLGRAVVHEVLRGRYVRLAGGYAASYHRRIGKPIHEPACDHGETFVGTQRYALIRQSSRYLRQRKRQTQEISVAFADVDADAICHMRTITVNGK